MTREKLICKSCGSTLDIDGTHEVLFCPYCGSKELIDDGSSDKVKIARIASDTIKSTQKERHRHEEEMRKVTENDLIKNRDDNRNSLIVTSICLIVMLLVLLICRSMM